MNVIIIEDEKPAVEKLIILLKKYDEGIAVLGKASSVKSGVELIQNHADELDLIFMDIQLTDGLSFEIFESVNIKKPIIFITAFDQYALEAFQSHAIDYLLKPITFEAVKNSLNKLKSLQQSNPEQDNLNNLNSILSKLQQKNYKERFMVKIGDHIHSILTADILFFYAEGRDAYFINKENKKYLIDHKLESLTELLDPKIYFRANRSHIVNIDAIKDVLVYSNSRLKLSLSVSFDQEVIISREKVAAFKAWYDGS